MRLILIVTLGAMLVPLASAASQQREGEVVRLLPGTFAWNLTPGDYLLSLSADAPGLSYEPDVSHANIAPALPCSAAPQKEGDVPQPDACKAGQPRFTGASVSALKVAPGEAFSLTIKNGTGRALVARPDLFDASPQVANDTATLRVNGTVDAHCVAYGVSDGPFHAGAAGEGGRFLDGPYSLQVAAPNADISVFAADLSVRARARDVLVVVLDANRGDRDLMSVQICQAVGTGPTPFAVHVERSAHVLPESRARVVPGLSVPLLVGVLLLVAGRNRGS